MRTMDRPVALGLILLTLIVIVFAYQLDDADPPPSDDERHEPITTSSPVRNETGGARENDHEGIRSTRFQGERQSSDAPPAPEGPPLLGRLVAVDQNGVAHRDLDGRLSLSLFDGRWGPAQSVPVKAGAWTCRASTPRFLRVEMCELNGRPVYCSPRLLELAAGRTVEITGAWASAITVHVKDADTGADLSNLRVLRGGDWRTGARMHPGDVGQAESVLRRAASPFALPMPEQRSGTNTRYWIHAPGHAWGKIQVDHASGGERHLELAAGGDLLVEVDGRLPEQSWFCLRERIGQRTGSLDVVVPATSSTTLIEGLRLGNYTLTVEEGELHQQRTTLATAHVTVVEGTTPVRLGLDATIQDPPLEVPVAGTLVLPATWPGWRRAEFVFEPLGAARGRRSLQMPISSMKAAPGRGDCFRWSLGRLQPGSYLAIVRPMDATRIVTVPATGDRNIEIVVPHPAEVIVRITDEASGNQLPVRAPSVEWHVPRPKGAPRRSPSWVSPDARGLFRFHAPTGAVSIGAHAKGRQWTRVERDLQPGLNRVTIALAHVCGISLVFKDGDTVVPFDWGWNVKLRQIGGDGKERTLSGNRVSVTRPGTYRFTVGPIQGFQAVPPRVIDIPAGTWVDVTVPLFR